MILSLAPARRVTAHFGHVRIVNFLQKITELRCPVASGRSDAIAAGGRRFRAGWAVNQGQVYRRLASGSGCERLSPDKSPRVLFPTRILRGRPTAAHGWGPVFNDAP